MLIIGKTQGFKIFDRLSTDGTGVLTSLYPRFNAIRVKVVAGVAQELCNYVCAFVRRDANYTLVLMTVDTWIKSLSLQTICDHKDLLLAKFTRIVIPLGNVINKTRSQTQDQAKD